MIQIKRPITTIRVEKKRNGKATISEESVVDQIKRKRFNERQKERKR